MKGLGSEELKLAFNVFRRYIERFMVVDPSVLLVVFDIWPVGVWPER